MATVIEEWREDFTEFYSENISFYGTETEGIDQAYNDFVEYRGYDILESDLELEFNEFLDANLEKYSSVDEALNDYARMNGFSEDELEEADLFSDFLGGEDYVLPEDPLESEMEEFYSNKDYSVAMRIIDSYGDYEGDLEELVTQLYEEDYSNENLYSDQEREDLYSSQESTYEEIADAFADFYSTNSNIYGKDLESAYSDFMESVYSERMTTMATSMSGKLGVINPHRLDRLSGLEQDLDKKIDKAKRLSGWDSESLAKRAIARGIIVGVPLGVLINTFNEDPDLADLVIRVTYGERRVDYGPGDPERAWNYIQKRNKDLKIAVAGGFLIASGGYAIHQAVKKYQQNKKARRLAEREPDGNAYGNGNPKSFNQRQPNPRVGESKLRREVSKGILQK